MAKNIKQVYDANPSTTIPDTTLVYLGLSPFDDTDDSAALWSTIKTQLSPLKTGTGVGNQLILQAYDVNDAVYRSFITLTANNIPALSISSPSGGTIAIDGATLGANSPITISQSTSITTNALTVNGAASVTNGLTAYRPIVSVTSTTKTLGLSDANTFQNCSNASAQVITFPADTTANLAVGSEIDFFQSGAGQLQFTAEGGVTLDSLSGNKNSIGQFAGFSAKKVAANHYILVGNLIA